MQTRARRLTELRHDDGSGHAAPLPAVGQLRRIAGRGEELAVAEAQKMQLVDQVGRLPGDGGRGEEGQRELQGGLHNGALQQQTQAQSDPRNVASTALGPPGPQPTLCRRLENDPVVLHLKVSWRSCPGMRSGLCHWNNMQVMPFQSPARTA